VSISSPKSGARIHRRIRPAITELASLSVRPESALTSSSPDGNHVGLLESSDSWQSAVSCRGGVRAGRHSPDPSFVAVNAQHKFGISPPKQAGATGSPRLRRQVDPGAAGVTEKMKEPQ